MTLTPEKLIFLKEKLKTLSVDICKIINNTDQASETVTLDQSRLGRLSRMDAMQQQEMAKAELLQFSKRLKLIQKALTKFEQDEYGWCEDCDEMIAEERLNIKPESQYCIKCQSIREQ